MATLSNILLDKEILLESGTNELEVLVFDVAGADPPPFEGVAHPNECVIALPAGTSFAQARAHGERFQPQPVRHHGPR